ncbi:MULTISPECIES: hypothetical protein [Pectobacterium]|uniref:hypothetical protein n=1 Tax=Pectobacterium TaxID=122277 RepID=UPI000EAD1B93|nr:MULTISPECIES: hypothetical protein [Pectobacterium]AYH27063.1 hypothetical protein C5E20_07910 [Pectobacterium parmentieri]MCA6960991.1 hypothetical protein [Pectobacterium odoriferum]MCH5009102.1 hypothetical protein [Pectobacterium odoriferum]
MAEKLAKCIVCNKDLSVLANECNGCNSPDPFGFKRAKALREKIFALVVIGAAIVLGGLWYFDIINPLTLIKF